jgi:hypothetical protein
VRSLVVEYRGDVPGDFVRSQTSPKERPGGGCGLCGFWAVWPVWAVAWMGFGLCGLWPAWVAVCVGCGVRGL